MKSRFLRLAMLAALCLGLSRALPSSVRAQVIPQIEDLQQATEEKAACIHNLKVIYTAIQKYQVDHKELPNWLSDLVPQYLDDVTMLTCPVCKRTGEAESSILADPKISTSYDYDFCPVPLGKADAPGDPTKTYRDWKRRQMGLVGSIVPLVRCRHHDVVLNLAYDGRVFESRGPWEMLVTNQIDLADLSAARIFSAGPKPAPKTPPAPSYTNGLGNIVRNLTRPALVFPPRDAATPANLINLATNYNAMLAEAWLGRPDNDLATLPTGAQTLGGVEYDLRGLIQLAGKGDSAKRYPAAVKGIEVNQKCARLHFLQASAFGNGVDENAQIGSYIVHFESNQMQLEIPILYGRDVRDWHTLPGEKPDAKTLSVVWKGTNKVSAAAHRQLRLFTTTWENVTPGIEINTIDFVSLQGPAAPFVIAITADP